MLYATMKCTFKIRRTFVTGIILTSLSGCSLSIMNFVRNLSNNPLNVTIVTPFTLSEIKSFAFYSDTIVEINHKTWKHLKDSLPVTRIDATTYSFIVPAHSTTNLWPNISLHFENLKEVKAILSQGKFTDTIKFDEIAKKLQHVRSRIYHYDYTDQK